MSIEIRKMQLGDISYVYEEELKIFGKSLGRKTLYNEIMYNVMAKYFIALVDDKRAGYVGSWLTLPNAEILNLFVSEKYRGYGIGKKLMDKVIGICQNYDIENLTLEVRTSNKYAVDLYNELGFVKGTIRKKYYENGEDALLMVLNLGVK
jgi:ribosomal-protein-alanine N-acetyltransferase